MCTILGILVGTNGWPNIACGYERLPFITMRSSLFLLFCSVFFSFVVVPVRFVVHQTHTHKHCIYSLFLFVPFIRDSHNKMYISKSQWYDFYMIDVYLMRSCCYCCCCRYFCCIYIFFSAAAHCFSTVDFLQLNFPMLMAKGAVDDGVEMTSLQHYFI